MIQKRRKILAGLLIIMLCVPANMVNTLAAEENEFTEEKPEIPEWEMGWNFYEGNWYYCNEGKTLYFGWLCQGETWYYLDKENSGIMVCNEVKEIDGKYYAFDSSGAMQTGWVLRPEGWYYADPGGAFAEGWRKVNGYWYYLDPSDGNKMTNSGWKIIENNKYFFNSGGVMATNWLLLNGAWYWLGSDGAVKSGWQKVNGNWYYLDLVNDNKMVNCGWKIINGNWYFLNSSGAMATNWLSLNGAWYWLGSDGAMKTGWQLAGGGWYYLEQDGHMITGWKKENNIWYFLSGSGQMLTGTHTINGTRYYFNQSGAMAEVDIPDLIKNALKPAGSTLYVWGGGWNAADNGSGETALQVGVWPEWEQYYQGHKQNYSYWPGKNSWEKGYRDSRFWGLDCSGYLGWLVYNSVQNGKDWNGYVADATKLASVLSGYGFGIASACTPNSTFYPGDIVSIKGHCFLSLGQCQDRSVLLLHSTPNGGVQMSGTVNGSGSSQASRLAQSFMQQYYPDWWNYFGKEGRQAVNAATYLNGTKLTWQYSGGVYDSLALGWKSADQIVEYLKTVR